MNGYVKKLEFNEGVKMGNNSMRWRNKIFMEKICEIKRFW
jgi:hypothetical protein